MSSSKANLLRKYADVIEMCEGTKVQYSSCIKLNGMVFQTADAYSFTADESKYQFAIAIVEDKPVFKGDKLWEARNGLVEVTKSSTGHKINYLHYIFSGSPSANSRTSSFTWNAPKKTTTKLNGIQLILPVSSSSPWLYELTVGDNKYKFESMHDRNKWFMQITNLLEGK